MMNSAYIWLRTLNNDIVLQSAYLINENDDLDDIIAQLINSYMRNVGEQQPDYIRQESLENIVRYTVFGDIKTQTIEPGRIVYEQIVNPYEFALPKDIDSFIQWALNEYNDLSKYRLNLQEITQVII